MKKVLLVLVVFVALFATACGSSSSGFKNKSTRTVEDLLDAYVKAYTTADVDIAKELFPSYYNEYAKGSLTKENLEASLKNAKEVYGDDFNITYNITKTTKLTEEELKNINDKMKSYYNAAEEASECYKYEGTITFKGSKDEDTDSISTMGYCNYNGSWYLVGGF